MGETSKREDTKPKRRKVRCDKKSQDDNLINYMEKSREENLKLRDRELAIRERENELREQELVQHKLLVSSLQALVESQRT